MCARAEPTARRHGHREVYAVVPRVSRRDAIVVRGEVAVHDAHRRCAHGQRHRDAALVAQTVSEPTRYRAGLHLRNDVPQRRQGEYRQVRRG